MTNADARIHPKQHFEILDGLRGVAAMMVVLFHLCETWNGGNHARQIINHGYLAVDFFFLLSGFVVAYAYDDRWHPAGARSPMSVAGFFKRRLIRLQPMLIMGNLLGAALFYFTVCWQTCHTRSTLRTMRSSTSTQQRCMTES